MKRCLHEPCSGARWWWMAVVLMLFGCDASARERLDDSASPRAVVQSPRVVSEYGYPLGRHVPGVPAPQRALVDFGRVEYRLATGPYLGRHARIYFVIPPLVLGLRSPQGLQVTWRSEGNFAAGTGRPGDRVLVWSGVVREPFMHEAISLRMEYSLRELLPQAGRGISVECYFEIEVGS